MPALSIVFPAHNEEQNIGPCLDQLLELLADKEKIELEAIVVADGRGAVAAAAGPVGH